MHNKNIIGNIVLHAYLKGRVLPPIWYNMMRAFLLEPIFNPQTIRKEAKEAWNFWGILGGLMRNF